MANNYPDVSGFSLTGMLKLIRWPNLLIIAVSQYLGAIFLIGPPDEYKAYLGDYKLFFISLGTILIAAAGYIINDYYDIKIDYINKPEKVIVGNLLKRRVAMFIHTGLNVAGLICGLAVSLKVASLNLLASIWLWGYSNQLKRMPMIGNLSVAILSGLAIVVLELHYQSKNNLVYIYAVFAFFVSLIRELVKDIEDLKGDETYGCKTLPVVAGLRTTKSVILGLAIVLVLLLTQLLVTLGSARIYVYLVLILIPASLFIYKLWIADTRKQFHQLSSYLKWIMVAGILSMVLI